MELIDRGSGLPVVLIPGVQGRWEWMRPAVEQLAHSCRVITFSLCDEPCSGFPNDPNGGVENYLAQLDAVFARSGLKDAVIVGVSYGGAIAAEFAARHPERVRALVLVSALPLDWQPDPRARFFLRAPLLLSPLFFLTAPLRSSPEVRAALPALRARARFSATQVACLLSGRLSPTRMAGRLRSFQQFRFSDPAGISLPVLVITGEAALDRVVPTEMSERYLRAIPHARRAVLPRTGHLGLMTRPREFTTLVTEFIEEVCTDTRRSA